MEKMKIIAYGDEKFSKKIGEMTVQISPLRKLSGVCDTSDQISAKWSFQLESAFSRVDTTQLSLTYHHLRNVVTAY
mgnify:CR=1 FL=1